MKAPRTKTFVVFQTLAALAFALPALGDGRGVLVQKQGDRLVIGFDNDTPGGQQIGARAFGDLLPPTGISQDPSFLSVSAAPTGSEPLPIGEAVSWDFLPMTVGGFTSNLLHWDGVSDFNLAPADAATLTLYDPNFNEAVVDGAGAAVPGLRLGTTTGSSLRLHAHRFWELKGIADAEPAPGIYVAALRIRMDGLIPSEPLFVALGTIGTTAAALNDITLPWLDEQADSLILKGDYDFNGSIDSSDYDVWASQFGTATPHPIAGGEADGNGDGVIDAADYTVWRDALAASAPGSTAAAVPEPATALVVSVVLALEFASQRRQRR